MTSRGTQHPVLRRHCRSAAQPGARSNEEAIYSPLRFYAFKVTVLPSIWNWELAAHCVASRQVNTDFDSRHMPCNAGEGHNCIRACRREWDCSVQGQIRNIWAEMIHTACIGRTSGVNSSAAHLLQHFGFQRSPGVAWSTDGAQHSLLQLSYFHHPPARFQSPRGQLLPLVRSRLHRLQRDMVVSTAPVDASGTGGMLEPHAGQHAPHGLRHAMWPGACFVC